MPHSFTLLACKRQLAAAPTEQQAVKGGHWWPVARQHFLTLSIILSFSCGNRKLLITRV